MVAEKELKVSHSGDPTKVAMSVRVHATVEKWNPKEGETEQDVLFRMGYEGPDEVVEHDGNVGCNAGIQRILDLAIGAGGQAFDNTHCRIGVGDGTTAVAATDTDLSAAAGSSHRWFQLMDATYPSRSGQVLTFKITVSGSDANFVWQEFGIDGGTANSTTVATPLLDHALATLGTKMPGAIWAFTVTITLS